MSDALVQTRREKICLHLLEEGGELSMSVLGEWCGLKLLVSHQPLSELLEGMVEDGLLRWDGTSFSLHSEGRALGEQAKAAGAGKRKKKATAPTEASAEPEVAATAAPVPAPPPAAAPASVPEVPPSAAPAAAGPAPEDGHDHGHSHGHSHSHEREGNGEEQELPPPRRTPPPAAAPTPEPKTCTKKRGLFARIKCRIKNLLGK